jgi:hypothetical protein
MGEPQLDVTALGVAATFIPLGKVSLNAIPVKATVFDAGLVNVNVRVLVAFTRMVEGLKALLMVGGETTASSALAVLPVPSSDELRAPVVLFLLPPVMAVTSTETVHVRVAGTVPPLKDMVVAPGEGLNVGVPQ